MNNCHIGVVLTRKIETLSADFRRTTVPLRLHSGRPSYRGQHDALHRRYRRERWPARICRASAAQEPVASTGSRSHLLRAYDLGELVSGEAPRAPDETPDGVRALLQGALGQYARLQKILYQSVEEQLELKPETSNE